MLDLPQRECPDCDGEGRIEIYDAYQSPTAREPATHMEYCGTCRGTGKIDLDWVDPQDELPPVGQPVLVIGLLDGAPDAVPTTAEDVLIDEGDDREPPRWGQFVRASEWAFS